VQPAAAADVSTERFSGGVEISSGNMEERATYLVHTSEKRSEVCFKVG